MKYITVYKDDKDENLHRNKHFVFVFYSKSLKRPQFNFNPFFLKFIDLLWYLILLAFDFFKICMYVCVRACVCKYVYIHTYIEKKIT